MKTDYKLVIRERKICDECGKLVDETPIFVRVFKEPETIDEIKALFDV